MSSVLMGAGSAAEMQDQLRVMHLSGTVSIPPRFPDLADIALIVLDESQQETVLLEARQQLSPKLVIKRSFFFEDVAAVFVPHDASNVDLKSGQWYHGRGLRPDLFSEFGEPVRGIIYVRESAQSMLQVEAGLTAAESAEYYPPLAPDRSVNHYSMFSDHDVQGCCL